MTRINVLKYYVYAHKVSKQYIYIGAGMTMRPYVCRGKGRSKLWHKLVLKNKGYIDVFILGVFPSFEKAHVYEVLMIKKFKPICNLRHNGFHVSKEVKATISRKLQGNVPGNKGSHLTKKQKQHLSKINTGKRHTKESKIKIGLAGIGRKIIITTDIKRRISQKLKGRKLSIEHRMNIGLGQKGRISPMKGKRHSAKTIKQMRLSQARRWKVRKSK